MTVVSLGDQEILEQIEKQLRKLEDVHDIKELRSGHSVYRELILVKVRANASERMAINAIAEIFPRLCGGCGKGIRDSDADGRSVEAGRDDQSAGGL